jgi:hypothetical protein
MNRLGLFLSAAFVAVVASTAAWAVTDGSFTANDEQGKPIDGATVTVKIEKKPDPQKPKAEKHVVQKIETRTGTTGKVDLQYDEKITSKDDYIAIIEAKRGGKTWTTTEPLSSLVGGAPITLKRVIPTSISTRTPTTYTPVSPGTGPIPFSGFGFSGFMSVNAGEQINKEYSILSDMLTSTLQDSNIRAGGGFGGVWNIPVSPGLLVGPYANVNFPHQSLIRRFPGGGSIGTFDCAVVDFGAQFGIPWRMTDKDALLYFQVGAAETEQHLKIDFMTSSVDRQSIWGWTVGAGVAMQPQGWQIADKRVSVFAQANWTNWQDGRYVNPLASQGFFYNVQRDDLTFKGGATIWFNSGN